ncbi:MAG: hypothetical protein ACLFP8_05220 [Alphaproteobacteria bacterium]
MSDESYLLEPKEKEKKSLFQWMMLLLKITFFLCAFALVIFTVLANMGGNSETLHESVRSFISEFTGGRPVKLGKLNYIGFFPTVRVDIENVEVYAHQSVQQDNSAPVISLSRLKLAMPFWNVATRLSRVTEFYLEDLQAIRGAFIPEEFSMDRVYIDHNQTSKEATLRAVGKIGFHEWSADIGMKARKGISRYSYAVASQAPFVFELADIQIKGTMNRTSSRHFILKDLQLRSHEKTVNGEIEVSRLDDDLIKITGTLITQGERSIIKPDIVLDISRKNNGTGQISGDIKADKLYIEDILGKENIFNIITRLRELAGHEQQTQGIGEVAAFIGDKDLDLDIFLKDVDVGQRSYEALSFDLRQEAGRLRISEITGKDDMRLMPASMVLDMLNDQTLITIMQEGTLEMDLLRLWLKNLPPETSNMEKLNVRCAIGHFSIGDDGKSLQVKNFAVDTREGMFTVKEKTLNNAQSIFDAHFQKSETSKLEQVLLPKEHYDFVQASLHKKGEGSPCETYITLLEERPQPKEQTGAQQDSGE